MERFREKKYTQLIKSSSFFENCHKVYQCYTESKKACNTYGVDYFFRKYCSLSTIVQGHPGCDACIRRVPTLSENIMGGVASLSDLEKNVTSVCKLVAWRGASGLGKGKLAWGLVEKDDRKGDSGYAMEIFQDEDKLQFNDTETTGVFDSLPDVKTATLEQLYAWAGLDFNSSDDKKIIESDPKDFETLKEVIEQGLVTTNKGLSKFIQKHIGDFMLKNCQGWAGLHYLYSLRSETFDLKQIRGFHLLLEELEDDDEEEEEGDRVLSEFLLHLQEEDELLLKQLFNYAGETDVDLSKMLAEALSTSTFEKLLHSNMSVVSDHSADAAMPLPVCFFNGRDVTQKFKDLTQFCPLFRYSITDRGLCLSFNAGKVENTYKVRM